MKILLVTLVLAGAISTVHSAVSFTDDFVQGFESGIFLRTASDRAEYGCPEPHAVDTPFGNPLMMMSSLKMMSGFMQDKSINGLVDTLEVFVSSISQLMGVFSATYEGDDFCCGLIFGSNGAQMLVNIAKTFINVRNMGVTLTPAPATRNPLSSLLPKAEDAEASQATIISGGSKKVDEKNKKPNFKRFSPTKGDGEV